jgi:hypothetical protein
METLMSLVEWNGPRFKSDEPSRAGRKRARKAADDASWRKVCLAVNQRDKGRCRVCGRRCQADAPDMLRRGEHHHIVYRSAGGPDSTWNVLLTCLECHQDEHAHRMQIRGDADMGIEIWRKGEDGVWFLARREVAPSRWEHD